MMLIKFIILLLLTLGIMLVAHDYIIPYIRKKILVIQFNFVMGKLMRKLLKSKGITNKQKDKLKALAKGAIQEFKDE